MPPQAPPQAPPPVPKPNNAPNEVMKTGMAVSEEKPKKRINFKIKR